MTNDRWCYAMGPRVVKRSASRMSVGRLRCASSEARPLYIDLIIEVPDIWQCER